LLEQAFERKAVMELLPLQPGDVPDTEADTSELIAATGYAPKVSIEEGVAGFARWHCEYYPDAIRIPRQA
jgi:UDP-glucuronate 4-epimerase